MKTVCFMCNKPASAQHLYPGPLRVWMYAPAGDGLKKTEGGRVELTMNEVDLHTPCVGSFLVLNKEKDLMLCLKP